MPVCIDAVTGLQLDGTRIALTCPACGTHSHLTPIGVPSFAELSRHRVDEVGIVYRCDACDHPVFLRHRILARDAQRVVLAAEFVEVERPREKFAFGYLPRHVEPLFRTALDCHGAGAFAGFALLCRQIALAMFTDLGATGRLRVFEELDESSRLAGLPQELFNRFKDLLFGPEPQPQSPALHLTPSEAGVLLEILKDVLSQCYVRQARLQRALRLREFMQVPPSA